MALKRKITATEHAALAEVLQGEYKKDGAGFVLDTDDATDLMNARDREKEAARVLKAEKAELQRLLDEATDKKNRENGDVAALDASYKQKIIDLEAKVAASDKRAEDVLTATHVTTAAGKIASKFTVPTLVTDRIAARLKVELVDGEAIVRVLDKAGKPSALSLVDLEKEFVDNPEYKSIVVGSRAGGSAPNPRTPGGSAPNFTPTDNNGQPVMLSKLSPKELAAHMKATDTEAEA